MTRLAIKKGNRLKSIGRDRVIACPHNGYVVLFRRFSSPFPLRAKMTSPDLIGSECAAPDRETIRHVQATLGNTTDYVLGILPLFMGKNSQIKHNLLPYIILLEIDRFVKE